MSIQSALDSYRGRRARPGLFGCLLTFSLLLLLSLLAGLIELHTFFIYQTYRQGSCMISSGKTDYYSSQHSSYYMPDFQYIVFTQNGQQVSASGYDGPHQQEYGTQEEAQKVVDMYIVGQTYGCWYNPANPTHAVLVFRHYTIGDFIGDYIWTSVAYLLGFGGLWWFIYYVFYRKLCLMRRGVLTEGRVGELFNRRINYRTYTYSRIFFSPLDDPSQTYKVEKRREYAVGSLQPVCYDPVNPKNAQYGGRPSVYLVMTCLAGVIAGIILAGGILLDTWNGV